MDSGVLFPLIALVGLAVIGLVIKYVDNECETAKKENREVKESSAANVGCIIGVNLVIIGFVVMNLQDCSNSSHYQGNPNIEDPIHRQ